MPTRKTDITWYHADGATCVLWRDITVVISRHACVIDFTWYHLTWYHVIWTSKPKSMEKWKRIKISFYFAEMKVFCRKFISNRLQNEINRAEVGRLRLTICKFVSRAAIFNNFPVHQFSWNQKPGYNLLEFYNLWKNFWNLVFLEFEIFLELKLWSKLQKRIGQKIFLNYCSFKRLSQWFLWKKFSSEIEQFFLEAGRDFGNNPKSLKSFKV